MPANSLKPPQPVIDVGIASLIEVGCVCYAKNWSLATSSNYSIVLQRNPLLLLMTASGKNKSKLTPSDFVIVDENGAIAYGATDTSLQGAKASAETMLHVVLAKKNQRIGAIVHTHSVWSTILSGRMCSSGAVKLQGYEMLKALHGTVTHDTTVDIKIYPNTQDIAALAQEISAEDDETIGNGFLIEKHGLYATGGTIDEAMRHTEAFEFLFEVEVRSAG